MGHLNTFIMYTVNFRFYSLKYYRKLVWSWNVLPVSSVTAENQSDKNDSCFSTAFGRFLTNGHFCVI